MRKRLFVASCAVLSIMSVLVWWWMISPAKCSSIPVVWTAGGTPVIEATIDGKKCLLKLSSSNKFFLSLKNSAVEYIEDKTPQGTATWRDRTGNWYEASSYRVKNLTVGSFTFSDVMATGENLKAEQNNIIVWNNPDHNTDGYPKISGELGRPFLAKTNLLLDLGHDRVIVTNCQDSLKKYGIILDSMKKFPLEPEERGIVLKIDTGVGPLRLDINTGTTLSLVRSALVMSSPEHAARLQKEYRGLSYFPTDLVIGNTIIGRQEMYLTDLTEGMVWMDGCIGVDFLKKHLVYIDYRNKTVYIS